MKKILNSDALKPCRLYQHVRECLKNLCIKVTVDADDIYGITIAKRLSTKFNFQAMEYMEITKDVSGNIYFRMVGMNDDSLREK